MTRALVAGDPPIEAVLSVDWSGHRLLYIEAILLEAHRQNRRQLVIVDSRALLAPTWKRVDALLGDHELLTVDFQTAGLRNAVPPHIQRVIVLEADHELPHIPNILRRRRDLHAVLLLMREPGVEGLAQAARAKAVSMTKIAFINILKVFGSRCEVHILKSPLFKVSSSTASLVASNKARTILDPVLKLGRTAVNRTADNSVRAHTTSAKPTALVVGRIDSRKSIKSLFAAWPESVLSHCQLVLRGEVHHEHFFELLAEAKAKGADILLDDRHLSDDELHHALIEATVVFCLYDSSLPSGVAALAIDAGCPVIGFSHTNLGQAVSSYKLGTTVSSIDGKQLARAIEICQGLSRSEIQKRAACLHEHATTAHFAAQLLGSSPRST